MMLPNRNGNKKLLKISLLYASKWMYWNHIVWIENPLPFLYSNILSSSDLLFYTLFNIFINENIFSLAGLAHSLSRYKLKFSPDKVDTMIVQAVSLLDDLDKELNNYMMRCREWYGWHFPELGKIVTDNVAFVKTIKTIGKWLAF